MFSRTAQILAIPHANVRGMATLKEIRLRLKSVKNIQKITKSMKMVSAAKYARAEKDLKPARPYGEGAEAFFTKVEADTDESKPNHLVVAITSDRGLCGGVHSSVCKAIRAKQASKTQETGTKFVLVGDKSKQLLQKFFGKDVILSFSNIGKKPPNFNDATFLAEQLLQLDYKYGFGKMYFNKFRTVVSYKTTELQLFPEDSIKGAKRFYDYDSLDEEVVRSYQEFMLASRLYYALKEGACSEQSSRMTAMDSASKNAQEMISKLTLTFNRTRQAVITRELIEIISGAAAL